MTTLPRAVLVIDDDPRSAESLRASLAAQGIKTEFATEGLEAIEKLRENRYAAVVLDLMIHTGLNGFVVLDYVEQEQPETIARVFLHTALSAMTVEHTAPSLMSRYFRKCSDIAALAAAILACCAPRRDTTVKTSAFSVLVAEDDAATAGLETDLLQQCGFSPVTVSSGPEVLEAVRSRDFDALLLDLVIPGIDGFQILDALRTIDPRLMKRVIVVTGLPSRYLAGIDRHAICGVIQKPVNPRELSALVAKCCEGGVESEGQR